MSAREWQPGDVALGGDEYVTLSDEGVWYWATTALPCLDQPPTGLRHLVVIDPEDREQVERFVSAYEAVAPLIAPAEYAAALEVDDALFAAVMQAALREFANPTPPKPDEPQGLGAVVEDADGMRWMRGSSMRGLTTWCNDDALDSVWRAYRDIAAVRVLSEGVPS